MDNKNTITLQCNKCNTIFKITSKEIDKNNYYAVCVKCGASGYKALKEIKE